MNKAVDFQPEYFEEEARSLSDYIAILKRRRKPAIFTLALLTVLSIGLALNLPAVYRSTAVILIEQQEIPTDLVRSTITSFADQRIQVITQRVMTSANLIEMIKKFDLYAEQRAAMPLEQVVEMLKKDTKFEMISADVIDPRSGRPTAATIAFSLGFDSESPQTAQQVANELTSLYLQENIRGRTKMVTETTEFLNQEAERLEEQIAELEGTLAAFKERNLGYLPEQAELNLRILDRVERDIDAVDAELRTLGERTIYLGGELAQLDPTIPRDYRVGMEMVNPDLRAQALQTEYLRAISRYSDSHPDVVKLRNELAALGADGSSAANSLLSGQLEAARSELAAALEKYAPAHPDVTRLQRRIDSLERSVSATAGSRSSAIDRPNPAYVQIKSQLEAARLDREALQLKREELRRKFDDLENKIKDAPRVEREYKDLTRDYENAMAKYQEIKDKQLEARLAESLETGNKGERFTLIEPAVLPEQPVKPNRLAILALGTLLSIAGALGIAFLLESMDSSITSRHSLIQVAGFAPLAVIPTLVDREAEERKKKRTRLATVVVVLVGLGLFFAVVHVAYRPLDVLMTQLLRIVGLGGA